MERTNIKDINLKKVNFLDKNKKDKR